MRLSPSSRHACSCKFCALKHMPLRRTGSRMHESAESCVLRAALAALAAAEPQHQLLLCCNPCKELWRGLCYHRPIGLCCGAWACWQEHPIKRAYSAKSWAEVYAGANN